MVWYVAECEPPQMKTVSVFQVEMLHHNVVILQAPPMFLGGPYQ